MRTDQHRGHTAIDVMLGHKGRQHFARAVVMGVGREKWLVAQMPAAAHHGQVYANAPACRSNRDHVHIVVADFFHGLLLQRSEERTSELQSLMRISYAVFCLKKKTKLQ